MDPEEPVSSPTTATDMRKHVTVCHLNEGFEGDSGEARTTSPIPTCENLSSEVQENERVIKTESGIRKDRQRESHVEFHDIEMVPAPKIRPKAAVTVRDAMKRYGSGPPILNNFNMTVQKGTIYSLLGSSGCGKTTLLSCVVGIRHLQSGQILVFGAKPGSIESGIPGRRVGYMPQETALYNDFSITEAIRYFGTLYNMPESEIASSQDFLVGFLDLPDANRRINTLSGGQKRRVSLSLSLVHSPELLILDEPTVGVDPLLRESIWNHLCKLVSTHQTTVIITTHYIGEARKSDTIGLMRGGRLLAEKSPAELLEEHNTVLLEDIVLKLCRKDVIGNYEDGAIVPYATQGDETIVDTKTSLEEPYGGRRRSSQANPFGKRRMSMLILGEVEDVKSVRNSMNRLKALIRKNLVVMTRNLILLLFMILVPAIQVFVVCIAIGNDPKPMWIGIVNHETNFSQECLMPKAHSGGCDVENLSCQFLSKLPQDTIFMRSYDTEEEARNAVKQGRLFGFMAFPEGFSDNVYTRSSSGNIVDDETLTGSQIQIELDQSNKQIAGSLKRIFYDGYKDFVRELLTDCGFHPELGDSPLQFNTPIFGSDDTDFKEFVAPGVLLAVLFFFPICSSGISYIWDKKQGTLERSMVAGVQGWEIILAFFTTETVVLAVQIGFSFTIVCGLFGIEVKGSIVSAVVLSILMGLAGVSLGFTIASFCNEEIEGVLLAMGTFFPNFLLSGMLWPIEGMPMVVQYIAYLLPCTLAGESIRSIVSRGWGIDHVKVWPGFASLIFWIIIYSITTIVINKKLASRK